MLPATTSMEHADLYRSFGHFYLQYAVAVLPPQGEAHSNWDVFAAPRPGAGRGRGRTTRKARSSSSARPWPRGAGHATIALDRLREEGFVRLDLPRPYRRSPTARPRRPGRSSSMRSRWPREGLPRAPHVRAPGEGPANVGAPARFPLQCIVPPNRFFLNSSFSQSERLAAAPGPAAVMLSPADAASRGIGDGDECAW